MFDTKTDLHEKEGATPVVSEEVIPAFENGTDWSQVLKEVEREISDTEQSLVFSSVDLPSEPERFSKGTLFTRGVIERLSTEDNQDSFNIEVKKLKLKALKRQEQLLSNWMERALKNKDIREKDLVKDRKFKAKDAVLIRDLEIVDGLETALKTVGSITEQKLVFRREVERIDFDLAIGEIEEKLRVLEQKVELLSENLPEKDLQELKRAEGSQDSLFNKSVWDELALLLNDTGDTDKQKRFAFGVKKLQYLALVHKAISLQSVAFWKNAQRVLRESGEGAMVQHLERELAGLAEDRRIHNWREWLKEDILFERAVISDGEKIKRFLLLVNNPDLNAEQFAKAMSLTGSISSELSEIATSMQTLAQSNQAMLNALSTSRKSTQVLTLTSVVAKSLAVGLFASGTLTAFWFWAQEMSSIPWNEILVLDLSDLRNY